jgi:hypothetical protein
MELSGPAPDHAARVPPHWATPTERRGPLGAAHRVPASRNRSWPLGTSTRCRALRCTQRSSSVRGDQDELSARDDLWVRLHLALEVIEAHAQRCGRFLSGHGVVGHCCEGPGRAGSHLIGVVVGTRASS